VNKDLADVLGNFVNRITRFCNARFGAEVPAEGQYGDTEATLEKELDAKIKSYTDNLSQMEFRKAFADLRAIWVAGNEYLQIAAPWTAIKEDREKAAASVRCALNLIVLFAVLSRPVIPFTADKMFAIFGLDPDAAARWPGSAAKAAEYQNRAPSGPAGEALNRFKGGEAFTLPEVLFAKIEEDQIAAWRTQFGAE
jgi:methionyl-tRNA synthetase